MICDSPLDLRKKQNIEHANQFKVYAFYHLTIWRIVRATPNCEHVGFEKTKLQKKTAVIPSDLSCRLSLFAPDIFTAIYNGSDVVNGVLVIVCINVLIFVFVYNMLGL